MNSTTYMRMLKKHENTIVINWCLLYCYKHCDKKPIWHKKAIMAELFWELENFRKIELNQDEKYRYTKYIMSISNEFDREVLSIIDKIKVPFLLNGIKCRDILIDCASAYQRELPILYGIISGKLDISVSNYLKELYFSLEKEENWEDFIKYKEDFFGYRQFD